jgi:uncharacterized membrane protein
MTHAGSYYGALALACIVAAFSLVQNSVEGVIASMLISPIGGPITAFASTVAAGRVAVSDLIRIGVSAAAMFAAGYGVRAFVTRVGSGRPRTPSSDARYTDEMKKRSTSFVFASVFAYATAIGIAMAIVSDANSVASTGLAIAISILPPVVNAGVLVRDAVDAARANDKVASGVYRRDAATSASLAGTNVVGVVIGVTAVAVWRRFG